MPSKMSQEDSAREAESEKDREREYYDDDNDDSNCTGHAMYDELDDPTDLEAYGEVTRPNHDPNRLYYMAGPDDRNVRQHFN